mgnify:CR=1 FL=1
MTCRRVARGGGAKQREGAEGFRIRLPFALPSDVQSLNSFVGTSALLSACGATDMRPGGPYQSRTAVTEMVYILSQVRPANGRAYVFPLVLRNVMPFGAPHTLCGLQVIEKLQSDKIKDSPYVHLSIDESTCRAVQHHLAIYVSYLDKHFNVHNDFFQLERIKGSASGEAIFDILWSVLKVTAC